MSRASELWLRDILRASRAISDHLSRAGLDDGLVFDGVRMRLIEIGEAVKRLDPETLASEPDIPWTDVAGMRDHIAHRYFDTLHAIVQRTVTYNLPILTAAVERLLERVES